MKKVLHINLGSYPFTIDIDAYGHLENYLNQLEKHFDNNDNPEEIVYDIECRLAELFHENLGENPILTLKDVQKAIGTMGRPQDFGEDNETEEEIFTKKNTKRGSTFTSGKKLYRDPKNGIIGGVCSGISAYFGIQNPVWLRLLALILLISGGLALPVYIVLWIVIPKAETEVDFKAMKGDPIDIETIATSVEEEINSLSDQVQDWADDFRKKRRQRKYRKRRSN